MLRLKRSVKRHSIKLLVGLVAILEVGCATSGLPPPPSGNIYSHFESQGVALCSQLDTGEKCEKVPISQTDKWYMLPPATWESVQNYIDELIRIVESSSDDPIFETMDGGCIKPESDEANLLQEGYFRVTPHHLRAVGTKMRNTRWQLMRQR